MNEQEAIEQLNSYRQMEARMHLLSEYSVGYGITVSRLSQDDQLQDLHRKLRGLPSYMYLNKHEQRIETTAHAYLQRYPAGIRGQRAEVMQRHSPDQEDEQLLRELERKIEKVIAARGYEIRDDIDAVLERVAELQDLKEQINRIDMVLEFMQTYKPEYVKLLRLRYVEENTAQEVAAQMGIAERTFRSWRTSAINEFIKLAA